MRRLTILFSLSFITTLAQVQLDLVALLPLSIQETSGLIRVQNTLITHNDSGGSNALYVIDPNSGFVNRTCHIANVNNVDWEDLAADNQYLYIADFGNNSGARTDLKIYRVSQVDFFNTPNDTVFADTISFTYSDQIDFTAGSNQTNYDAEALMVKGDSLYIFSKRWLDQSCQVYALSKIPGTYTIDPVASIPSEGLVTGAVYDTISSSIFLCGYGPPIPFLIEIKNFNSFPIETSQMSKKILDVPVGSSVQIEAITLKSDSELFLSSETSVLGDASLMSLDFSRMVNTTERSEDILNPHPNPCSDYLFFENNQGVCFSLYDLLGKPFEKTCTSGISLKHLPNGIYFLVEEDNKNVYPIIIENN